MNKNAKILSGLVILAALIGTVIVWNAYSPVLQQYGDQQRAADTIRDQVTDGDNAIRQYEWFETQREKIEAQETQIENQRMQIRDFKERNDMSDLSRTQEVNYDRMTTRLLGYRDQHANLVAEYNAQMNMETRNLYNDSLPLEMEDKFWTGDLIP